MNRMMIATTLCLGMIVTASADDRSRRRAPAERSDGRPMCTVDVVNSEELPGAPIFQSLVRTRLRVTPADRPPFETTVERLIPWQVPPPRRGQRLKILCDPAAFTTLPFPFGFLPF